MADAMYQWSSVHLDPPICRCYKGKTAQISEYPGRELACPTPILATDMSERVRKNTGTSTALTAETPTRTQLRALSPFVISV